MTPETQNVEWKRSWRDEHLAWICGFANAQGGVLEIGKNDDGDVVGVRKVPSSACAFPSRRRISQRLAAASGSADRGTTPITTPTTPITTPKTEPIPVANQILALLETEPGITQTTIAERVGLTVEGVKYHFRKLREDGVIRRVGSSRAGHWEVL